MVISACSLKSQEVGFRGSSALGLGLCKAITISCPKLLNNQLYSCKHTRDKRQAPAHWEDKCLQDSCTEPQDLPSESPLGFPRWHGRERGNPSVPTLPCHLSLHLAIHGGDSAEPNLEGQEESTRVALAQFKAACFRRNFALRKHLKPPWPLSMAWFI